MGAALDSLETASLWRWLNVMASVWMAMFFAKTLRPGHMPLIERIARASDAELSPALCRYTRRLTAFWSAYFVVAALLSIAASLPAEWTGPLIALGAAVLFVGECWLRPRFFPAQRFPGLLQQLRDTWNVWRCRP